MMTCSLRQRLSEQAAGYPRESDGSDAVVAMVFFCREEFAVSSSLSHFLASTVAIFGGAACCTADILGLNFNILFKHLSIARPE